jgi:hypothetical protein
VFVWCGNRADRARNSGEEISAEERRGRCGVEGRNCGKRRLEIPKGNHSDYRRQFPLHPLS